MEFKQEALSRSFDPSILDSHFSLYNFRDSELKDFKVENDGKISVKGEGNYEFTPSFLDSFCKLLTIPYSFGKKIPIDLLQFNVDRLKGESKINSNVKFVFRNNILVNVLKTDSNPFFKSLKPSEIISHFNPEKFDITECVMGDYGLTMDVTHKDLSNFEVTKPGDIVSIGYRFSNPFTMFGTTFTAGLYLRQLVCSNGMVANKSIGFKKPSINLRNNLGGDEMYMEAMDKSLRESISKDFSLEKLSTIIKGMLETKIDYRHLQPMLNKVSTYQPEYMTAVFNIDWTKEKQMYEDLYKSREKDLSTFKYFDVMFKMTQECQKLDLRSKLQIEEYSDTIINSYKHQISLN